MGVTARTLIQPISERFRTRPFLRPFSGIRLGSATKAAYLRRRIGGHQSVEDLEPRPLKRGRGFSLPKEKPRPKPGLRSHKRDSERDDDIMERRRRLASRLIGPKMLAHPKRTPPSGYWEALGGPGRPSKIKTSPHFGAVTLENSVAPSGSPAENRPANAIARIPTARTDPRMAFALHHPSNSRGWLGKSRQTPFPMMTLPGHRVASGCKYGLDVTRGV
jgi:hypothetical protein